MIPIEVLIFAATLGGVALSHHRAFTIALLGLGAVIAYKFIGPGFAEGAGLGGFGAHLAHEGVTLANLFLLLTGFALLARHFEDSGAADFAPNLLPDNWWGGVVLLGLIFVLSAFLDNIAAALIGGAVARHVYRGQVHIGFLVAIVAASNAGGAGSVVGDTTTTMIWLSGVSPLHVLPAYVAAVTALIVVALPAAGQQQRFAPIVRHLAAVKFDGARLAIVLLVLTAAIGANVTATLLAPALLARMPVIGMAVWAVLAATGLWRAPDWAALPAAAKGAVFLLALVLSASLMPLQALPAPSATTVFVLGVISSAFDNIPLTAMAIHQGGYDWAMLAYAVGFGGSMLWFGSSAGVALTGQYPQARNAWAWLKAGWFVPLGYCAGFAVMLLTLGWRAP